MISCDPGQLLSRASCFSCLTEKQERQILTYLYCQLNSVGGFGLNLIPPGSTYTGSPAEFDLIVAASTTYTITWGAAELSMTLCGVTYPSTGAGTITIVHTGTCTLMQFFGTFAGTTVTARVKVAINGEVPIPSGFSLSANASGQTLAKWSSPPSNVAQTEVWTSPDNITFALAGTFTKPATSGGVTSAAVGALHYVKIRWIGATLTGAFTSSKIMTGRTTDWAKRVVTNGGAIPSDSSISALNTFEQTLMSTVTVAQLKAMNVCAPDSLIAAITPFYVGGGSDPWTNNGVLAADVSVDGIQFDGISKYLNTGFDPNAQLGHDGGMAIYTNANYNVTTVQWDLASYDAGATRGIGLGFTVAANLFGFANGNFGTMFSSKASNAGPFRGMIYAFGFNNAGVRACYVYKANSSIGFVNVYGTNNQTGVNLDHWPAVSTTLGAINQNGVVGQFSNKRISFAVHHGFTDAGNGQALFNAVQALRTALGGGFV